MTLESDDLEENAQVVFSPDGRVTYSRQGRPSQEVYNEDDLKKFASNISGADIAMQRALQVGIRQAGEAKDIAQTELSAIKEDCRALYRLHITPVIEEARTGLQDRSTISKVATVLSVTGRLWEGLSNFWGAMVKKHKVLEPLHKMIIVPAAIALYAATLPEIGLIKACEFVGRSIKAYRQADKGKKWGEVIGVAKKMGKEIWRHIKSLKSGSALGKVVTELGNVIGIKEHDVKPLVDLLSKSGVMEKLEDAKLDPVVAAQGLMTLVAKGQGLDGTALITTLIDATSSKKQISMGEFFSKALIDAAGADNVKKWKAAVGESGELSVADLVNRLKKSKLPELDKANLIKYATQYAVEKLLKEQEKGIVGPHTEKLAAQKLGRARSRTI